MDQIDDDYYMLSAPEDFHDQVQKAMKKEAEEETKLINRTMSTNSSNSLKPIKDTMIIDAPNSDNSSYIFDPVQLVPVLIGVMALAILVVLGFAIYYIWGRKRPPPTPSCMSDWSSSDSLSSNFEFPSYVENGRRLIWSWNLNETETMTQRETRGKVIDDTDLIDKERDKLLRMLSLEFEAARGRPNHALTAQQHSSVSSPSSSAVHHDHHQPRYSPIGARGDDEGHSGAGGGRQSSGAVMHQIAASLGHVTALPPPPASQSTRGKGDDK